MEGGRGRVTDMLIKIVLFLARLTALESLLIFFMFSASASISARFPGGDPSLV